MKRRAQERTLCAADVLLCLLLACPCVLALDPNLGVSQYAHNAWKIREGFTKGQIWSIAQTRDGYLWLGTDAGLYRFDGVRNVLWQPTSGQHLPAGSVWSLLAARDGTLWIGTEKGLASLKEGKLTLYGELTGVFVFSILEDRDGAVWVGALGVPTGRLCVIQNGSIQCHGKDGTIGLGIFGLYQDRKGNLWAGVTNGLWRWKPGPSRFYPIPDQGDRIRCFAEDDDGSLLISTRAGIKRFVDGQMEPYPLLSEVQHFRVLRTLRDRERGLWLATDHGIVHLHLGRADLFARADGLTGNEVITLLEDHEGDVWAVTSGGLDRFREIAVPSVSSDQGLSADAVGAVLADRDGSVWLATERGLDRAANKQITPALTGSAKRDGRLNGDAPNSLFQDDRGRIWVSTRHGFGYLEKDRFTPISAIPGGGWVHGIAQDNDGDLWIANQQHGLFRLSARAQVHQTPWTGLGHQDYATALIYDPVQGGLWLGFFHGGVAFYKEGGIRASFATDAGLGEGAVNSFRFDQDGALWVSTQDGLSRLKNGRFATLNSKNGLPCDPVHWMIEDDDHSFWLHMACGLARITHSDIEAWASAVDKHGDAKRAIQAMLFTASDGVITSVYAGGFRPLVAKSADGKLWFTGEDGASVLDPRHIPFNKLPPPVYIERTTAEHKTYEATPDSSGRVSLPPRVRDLQIDYTALSLVAPEKVLFRYRLEGWDHDWQDAGTRRQAFYSNLPPRNYTFRVKACNNSGVWNEAGASLNFSIDAAYYQTSWFRSLCVTVFLALLWTLYRWRVQQVRGQEERLRDVVDTIPAMAFVSRPDGYRTFVNKGWVEYTGMTVEQSLGSGWHAAIHPADLKEVLRKWEETLATGKSMYYEARYRQAHDGQYRWFMVRVAGQRDNRGKIVKWFGTVTDIEDRKRAEQEREKLRQLEDDMAHINRVSMLGEMAASLAHEIKQPIAATITSANTCVEWLAHEPPNLDRARAAAARIDKYGNRATEIIDRIRSLYRKSPAQRELVDINGIIEELLALLKCEADRYSIGMRKELSAELPRITADRVQLQQVLMNLMLNGIEAMKESGGELTVRSEREDSQLLFTVSDTGVGLPTEKVEQIFSAFFTTKPQGSGMGLAISRSIVESHGGRLWATANDGRGATFQFMLPIEVTDPSAVGFLRQ